MSGRETLMSRALQAGFASIAAVVLLTMVSPQPAAARIRCEGEFQVTQYGLVATPYCGEEEMLRLQIAMDRAFQRLRSTIIP